MGGGECKEEEKTGRIKAAKMSRTTILDKQAPGIQHLKFLEIFERKYKEEW